MVAVGVNVLVGHVWVWFVFQIESDGQGSVAWCLIRGALCVQLFA